jgi:hypothetical protein
VLERVVVGHFDCANSKGKNMKKRTINYYCLMTAAVFAFADNAIAAGAKGVTEPAFYVDGELFRTVNTPTDLSRGRAPASSFDIIYDFGGLQPNVATAARGILVTTAVVGAFTVWSSRIMKRPSRSSI